MRKRNTPLVFPEHFLQNLNCTEKSLSQSAREVKMLLSGAVSIFRGGTRKHHIEPIGPISDDETMRRRITRTTRTRGGGG